MQRYRKLIRGLDPRSLSCVSRILGRMEHIAGLPNLPDGVMRPLDIWTSAEAAAIRRCHLEFDRQIIPLDHGVFAWRDHLLPIRRFEASVLYYRHQLGQLRHPERLRHKAVIDAGAFIGDSALVLRRYSSGPIFCFEPLTENFRLLQRTLQLNDCRNVHPVNKALGRASGWTQVHGTGSRAALDPARSPLPEVESQEVADTEVTTLDDFCRGLNLDIGLIKTDLEGFEQEFLAGARETIARHRPVLLISIYHNAADFFDIKPLIESWDLDYTFQISRPPLLDIYFETMLICEPDVRQTAAASQPG